MFDLNRGSSFTNDVIVVDGMWGTGKSILSSLVGSLRAVEKKRIDHLFEYLAIGVELGKITQDFAQTVISIYADLDQYNNLIGREVNLRLNDDSGFRNTPGSFRYLRRLVGIEGEKVVDRINAENLALLLVTHHISAISRPLRDALGERLFMIEVIRHPLQLVEYWTAYLESYGRSREFTLSLTVQHSRVPWFAASWADEFVRMRPIDRAIRSIHEIRAMSFVNKPSHPAVGSSMVPPQHLVISFEHLVQQTNAVMVQVATFLGREPTRATARALRRQKVPRSLSSSGKASNPLSWLPDKTLSYTEQLSEVRRNIATGASLESQSLIDTLIADYEIQLSVLTTELKLHVRLEE